MNIRADLEVGSEGCFIPCDLTSESIEGNGRFILARVVKWQPLVIGEREWGESNTSLDALTLLTSPLNLTS